jgi:CBS domain-containing protein
MRGSRGEIERVIGGIRTRDVVFVRRGTDLVQVAEVMREQHVGSLVVVEDRANGPVPVGIVTDRDIVVSVVAAQVDPLKLNAGEVMSGDVLVAELGDEMQTLVSLFRSERAREKRVRRIGRA